ncbi:MAG: exopolysaccharide biosynthesis protein [Acidobacteria bacterium]|nr:exopolysaccharide biosynthesis protein [Acidobacteriota bacterium]
MIDIHCHVLPGVDDGPEDEATSIAMCRLAAENGTTDVVATPHANANYEYSPERNEEMRRQLQAAVGPSPRIHLGCDFHLSYDNIEAALADPAQFTINGGRYLLVEFSDLIISQGTSEVFARMQEAGVTPIITHPERNPLLRDHRSRLAAWVHRGCLIQITADSLLGRFGRHAQSAAIALVDANLAHIVASDGHDLKERPPVLAGSFEFVVDRWGEDLAQDLFVDRPRAVVDGKPLQPPAPKRRHSKKTWWAFWR